MKTFPEPGAPGFESLLDRLAGHLSDSGWTLATAESCTGGWIAKCCTDRAGSSAWFERGLVTYSNAAKMDLLGINPDDLARDGAVSRNVAAQMAAGARRNAGSEIALAVTGIAGPTGGSPGKPVGTVWVAWAIGGREVAVERVHFEGDRDAVRRQTVGFALQGLLERLGALAP